MPWKRRIDACRSDQGLSEFFSSNWKHLVNAWLGSYILCSFRQKAISSSDYGLQIPRLLRIVLERGTNLADCSVDALFNIHKDIFSPQPVCNLFASYELALILDQEHEQLQRETFQPEWLALAAQLETAEIEFEL